MNIESIVVLGSKPDTCLPDVSPKVVFGANGAVESALPYREKYNSKIVGVVPSIELRKHGHIQDSIKKASPDKMIVFGNNAGIISFIHNDMGLPNTEVELISNKERQSRIVSMMGWRIIPVSINRISSRGLLRGLKYLIRKVVPDILFSRDKDWISHSTGLDSVMYAMSAFPQANVITAGIGLQGGAHFNNQGEFMSKTAIADRRTMKYWPFEKRKNVYTTDDVMAEIGNVPKWEGKIFNKSEVV